MKFFGDYSQKSLFQKPTPKLFYDYFFKNGWNFKNILFKEPRRLQHSFTYGIQNPKGL
jgi:hypothetical protein